MKNNNKDKERKKLHSAKLFMIVIDILFIPLFIFQLKFSTINIPTYVILLFANIFVFLAKLK